MDLNGDNFLNNDDLKNFMRPTHLLGKFKDESGIVGFIIYSEDDGRWAFGESGKWLPSYSVNTRGLIGCMLDHLKV